MDNTELEDNIQSALASNPALRDKILFLVAERDAYWKSELRWLHHYIVVEPNEELVKEILDEDKKYTV